jgi:hypothetical protein
MGATPPQILNAVGSGLFTAAAIPSPASPFLVAAGALVELGGIISGMFGGCGQTCVMATNIVNQAEPILRQNLDAYMASPRTTADQAQALANFDKVWSAVVNACSSPQLSSAGQRCVTDRQAGACIWKNDGQGGPAGSGDVCWNWFVGYRDPIASDTPTDAGTIAGAVSGAVASLTNPATWLSDPLALAALALIVVGVAS